MLKTSLSTDTPPGNPSVGSRQKDPKVAVETQPIHNRFYILVKKWISVNVIYLEQELTASFCLLPWQLRAAGWRLGHQVYIQTKTSLHPLKFNVTDAHCIGIPLWISSLDSGWHTL